MQHVHDAGDLFVLIPDGHHQRGDVLAEVLPQGGEGGVVVHIVLVHFGDVDDAGHFALLEIAPGALGAHGQAALGGAHQNAGIGHGQALGHLAGKVEVARGVQDINFAAVIFNGRYGGGDGNLTLDLLLVIVADRITVGGLAQPVGVAGHVEEALYQGSLSVSAVP